MTELVCHMKISNQAKTFLFYLSDVLLQSIQLSFTWVARQFSFWHQHSICLFPTHPSPWKYLNLNGKKYTEQYHRSNNYEQTWNSLSFFSSSFHMSIISLMLLSTSVATLANAKNVYICRQISFFCSI